MSTMKLGLLASTALTVAVAAGSAHAQSSECDGLLERVEALPQELPEGIEWTIQDVREAAESGDRERCAIIVADVERMMEDSGGTSDSASASADAEAGASEQMQAVESAQTRVTLEDEAVVEGTVYLDREPANVELTEGETEIMVTPGQPEVSVNEQAAQITVREQPARITVEMAQPTIRIEQPAPEIIITMPEPGVDVTNAEPEIEVRQAEPRVTVSQASPSVNLELQIAENPDQSQGVEVEDRSTGERFAMGESREMRSEEANVTIARSEPIVRMQSQDGNEPRISVNRAEPQITFERAEPEVSFSQAGEPSVEFARAGEPSVTIRRANDEGGDSAQQASAAGGSGTQQQTGSDTGDSDLAQAESNLEQAGENVEAAAENAGSAIATEAGETGQEIETAAEQAGEEIEQGAENVAAAAEQAGEEAEAEAADLAAEAEGQPGDDTVPMSDAEATAAAERGTSPIGNLEGMTPVEFADLTMDDLDGAPLYGVDNERIGEVSEGVLAEDGLRIDGVVLEVGGFLGLGEHEVMLEIDRVQFVRADTGGEVRAYVDMTEEELEAMPEWGNQ